MASACLPDSPPVQSSSPRYAIWLPNSPGSQPAGIYG